MKVRRLAVKLILSILVIIGTSTAYAESVENVGVRERIHYHNEAYLEYWDAIISGEKAYKEEIMLIKENEVVNSIMELGTKKEIYQEMQKHNKIKELKVGQYDNKEQRDREDDHTKAIKTIVILIAVSAVVSIIPWNSHLGKNVRASAIMVAVLSILLLILLR